jgi:predicted phosphoadenosine phosphosulfate sulfurtransferase
MKIYSNKNVFDAATERVELLFKEFNNVVVGFSGGKDSTVVLNLCLNVAEKLNRLPLPVLFIDQEAEWKGTIDYIEKVMYDPRVKPMWFQMPMVITNNASSYNRYSYCWDENEKDKWIHDKNEISIKENKYGTDRFHDLFQKIFAVEFKNEKSCYIAGVRTEESPKRFVALTHALTYKWITWGTVLSKKNQHYTFYPIYDWSYSDVWKYINSNGYEYNKIYDELYRHGVSLNEMRISNLHHETAIQSLILVQEIEPETWNKIAARIDGASSIKHIKRNSFVCPKELPKMFTNWEEYAYHLAENIIQEDKYKEMLYRKLDKDKKLYSQGKIYTAYWKTVINTILSSDWDFTKYQNWMIMGDVDTYRRFKKNPLGTNKEKNVWLSAMLKSTKFLHSEEILTIQNYFLNEGHI